MNLSEEFWDKKYKVNDIGWDLGNVSPPLKSYIDQLNDRSVKILIPGGGNSYEAEYLFANGFKNVFVTDISKTALNNLKIRVPQFPNEQLIHQDFFQLENQFDLIIEQTFFCALNPILRVNYISKMKDLLSNDGKLVGLLFNVPLHNDRPPFGGSKEEYIEKFNHSFDFQIIEAAYNSHKSRVDKELFFIAKKKFNL